MFVNIRFILAALFSFIVVSCGGSGGPDSYVISGSIYGLTTSGLKLKNGSELISISSGSSTFAFSTKVANGESYAVTVETQPIGYTCSLTNSSGIISKADTTTVQVTCSINSYSLGGSISGLSASGLKLKNGSETLTVSSGSTSFAFNSKVASGVTYAVTVDTQPTGYTCSVTGATGVMAAADISSLKVECLLNPQIITYDETGNGITANSGQITTGSTVTFHLYVTDRLFVTGGPPTLNLNSGGTATYDIGSDADTTFVPNTYCTNDGVTISTCNGYLRFTYTVGVNDSATNLAVTSISTNGSILVNSNGTPLTTTVIVSKRGFGILKIN